MINQIIEVLEKNQVPYQLDSSHVFSQCPFCKHEDFQGRPMLDFLINLETGQGECNKCHKIAKFEEWVDILEPDNGAETAKASTKRPAQKRHAKQKDVSQPKVFLPVKRVKKIEKPTDEMSFEKWRDLIKVKFPGLVFPAEVAASVVAQILITEITNPFALVLVDVPSSGKTITLNFFDDIDGISYSTDKFTPASFVSNATNVPKEKLPEIDLLPRIRYKTLLIRDLATMFSKNEDALNESLGLLTRVLDGEGLNTDSGVHGQRHYSGDYVFMMLAASTPIQPRVWKVMGSIGSRLFFINMGTAEKSEAELVEQITTLSPKEKERACREATRNFLHTLWHQNPDGITWDRTKDKDAYKLIIARCAKLLAKLRGIVHVWEKKSTDSSGHQIAVMEYQPPVIEKPDRINQLFYNLSRGHAVISGRLHIESDDLRLPIELAIDSAPTGRAKLLRGLLAKNGTMKTSEVETCLQCSKPTALKEMETLKILGIAQLSGESDGFVGEPERKIHLSEEFAWFLSEECWAIRGLKPLPPTNPETKDIGLDFF